MPPVLDPSRSHRDGLAFLGLSLSRNSRHGNPKSVTHQTSFDLNEVQDRDYKYIFSTNDDGWLAGGGEPGPPKSYKLAAKDSSHVEIMRIGTFNPEWGGLRQEDIVKAIESGKILIPQIEVVPTAVVANRDSPPELEIRFDMDPTVPDFEDMDVPLPVNWQLRFIHNQLFNYFKFPSRFCPGAFHSTIVRKAEFRSNVHELEYFKHCEAVISKWRAGGPKPLNNGGWDINGRPLEKQNERGYNSGIYLFTDRENITHYFKPNFLPPYTGEKRKIILEFLKNRWDEDALLWMPVGNNVDNAMELLRKRHLNDQDYSKTSILPAMRRRNRSRYANRPAIIKRLGLRERIRSAQPLITQTCDKKKENPVKKTRTPNQRKNSDNQKEATDKMANIDRTRKRVIVVGAGISGLACARELHERNFNVLVLEARHRSGGRLKSVPMRLKTNDQIDKKGFRSRKNHPLCQQSSILNTMTSLEQRTHCPVDMGGAFIHGNDGNPIQELADRIGISTSRAMRGEDCHLIEFQNSGWPIAAEADFKAQERFNYILDQTFLMCNMILDANLKETKTKLKIPTVFTKDVSFGAVFEYVASDSKAEPLARPFIYSRTGGFPKDTVEALLFEWHVMNLEMSTGTTLDQLGLRWNDDEAYGYEGDHVLLKEGFSSILEGLEEGLDIKYGNEVSGIRVILGDGGMTVPIRKSTRKRNLECSSTVEMKDTVEVRTVQGLTFEADAVVCTLPLGILSIPEGEKGYISFYPPLPKPKCDAIEKLGFGYYNKCAMTFSESFWGSSADFIGVVGAPFAGSKILFCNASVAFGLPVIVMIYGGAYAKEVEDLSDEVIVSECIATLQRVCNSMDIPLPIDYCVTRWGKDKFSRGAFSYCPVGVDGEKEMGILSQPILGSYQSNSIPCRKPLLLFAGEATSPFHPSTIHGAYLSGIREAYRLDLSVYPEENNNISFDETFLYKRTFSLRKRFKRKANEETQVKSSLIKCRTKLPSNGSNRSNKPNQHVAGVVRKSRRLNSPVPISKSVTSSIGVVKDERTEQSETASTFSIIEDIALLRGIDMFGKDLCAIKNTMFPVPETYETNAPGRIRSFDEIRARLDELISGGAATAKGKGSEKIHDIWKVSTESEKWWKKIESEKDQMKKTPNGDRRESSRKSKRFQ